MKVAIIGAGVSGISCAIELERNKITPVIFEKNHSVGDLMGFTLIWPRQFDRSSIDPVVYLRHKYDINVKPLNHIRKIVLYSPNKKAIERGKLGYIFKKGYESYSLENQMAAKLNTQIIFNQYIDIDEVMREYDYVVVATGYNIIAHKLGVWTDTFIAHARAANVVGNFKENCITLWLDKNYSRNGFCYFIPSSSKSATLAMVINGITNNELDYYWQQFLIKEDITCAITSTTDSRHVCGFTRPHQKENVLFVGNAAGFTDDLIGCGSFNAIESGILAARAIAFGGDYTSMVSPIFSQIEKLHELRKVMDAAGNKDYDRMVSLMDTPGIKNIAYNNPFFKATTMAPLAKSYNSLMHNNVDKQ